MHMKNTLLTALAAAVLAAPASAATTINGAGATFPYPIYSKWFDKYHDAHEEVQINYQSIGSGGGIRQATEKTVDFGATDGPMTNAQLFKVDGKILHIPTVLGADVAAFNLKGVEKLTLSGPVLADIFLGKIVKWNDPAIKKLNPAAALPEDSITVIHRSDGSGTTYIWVDYLSTVSADWKKAVGTGTSVKWPVGLGGKGNEGVTGLIKQTPNSIGYVEAIYAKQNGISYAAIVNKAGKATLPEIENISAAAAGKKMPRDFRVSIVDAEGENAYPIASFTWLLVYDVNPAPKGALLKDFLRWMLKDGQKLAPELGYAPLPEKVNKMVAETIETIH
ncbi:MAG: phosphate ABC transporter substrate-binding protein PstS [Elusimicrobia bacterium]|nr:phosphate ABC transporter substrate-binding protein PstS [Elusimicrobiota bacterium]